MYIEPNTVIRILRSCPLNSKYEHTIYFSSVTAQSSYFISLTKHTLDRQSYQRVQRGKMRVAIQAELLYDCNYLMFQNTSFGSKWFYAFIKTVEYVNNATSEIEFEIDVMQTWFFDYQVKPSFVEREHAMDDSIGANTVPENLETGEYISDGIGTTGLLGGSAIVVAATFKYENGEIIPFHGGMYDGVYSGVYYNIFQPFVRPPGVEGYNGIEQLNEFLQKVSEDGKESGIVSVFQIPNSLINLTPDDLQSSGIISAPRTWEISRFENTTALGEYTDVKNNKLFTYPYNFFYVSNQHGNSCAFPYEFFSTPGYVTFEMVGDFSCNPTVILYPTNYKGVAKNYDEKISLTGFPQCAFSIDSYKSWLAQNGTSLAVNTVGGAVSTGVMTGLTMARLGASVFGAYGALVGGALSIATRVGSALAQVYEKSIMPRQALGNNSSNTLSAIGKMDFIFMRKYIKKEFAEIIDNYFSVYGYATNKVKIPNRNGRPIWNYVKTAGANIKGTSGVPADDMKKIIAVYDNGITFWRNGSQVGNYELDNSIQGGD